MRSELLKGHLDLLVLTTLRSEPGHGYVVVERLRRLSDGEFALPEGTIYPALHRLRASRSAHQPRNPAPGTHPARLFAHAGGEEGARGKARRMGALHSRNRPHAGGRWMSDDPIADYLAGFAKELGRLGGPSPPPAGRG